MFYLIDNWLIVAGNGTICVKNRILLWEMLTCVLRAQVNKSNIEMVYWKVCMSNKTYIE